MGSELQDPDLNWDFVQALDVLHSPTRHREQRNAGGSNQPSPVTWGRAGDDCTKSATLANPNLSRDSSDAWKFDSIWNILHSDVLDWTKTSLEHAQPDDARSHASSKALSSSELLRSLEHTVVEQPSQHGSLPRNFKAAPESSLCTTAPTACPSTPRTTNAIITRSPTRDSSAVKILKRPAKELDGNTTSALSSQSSQKQASKLDRPVTATSRSKEMANKAKQANKNDNLLSSESSAEAESDSSNIVFDRPAPRKPGVIAFVPPQVGALDVRNDCSDTPPSSYEEADTSLGSDKVKGLIYSSSPPRITPIKHKTARERRVFLMTKLLQNFPEYAQLVSQLGNARTSKKHVEPRPIHVFVDMSNILVGFHNAAKLSRNIPTTTRIRRLHISFAHLSLIMERGRRATKRVLVGSDRVPSIDEAEQLGYEANILDRVHKSKNITRSSRFHNKGNRFGGPETALTSEERWVEQGVDEILHLKMLESLVDTDEPSTIVLATGDAAEAEYSGGFLRMVERALQRGWNVELVSFAQLTSYAYKKKEFREKWGHRFRMVELDDYVEELFE